MPAHFERNDAADFGADFDEDFGADFHKYEALGNDYIVIDPAEFALQPVPEAVRLICDRNRGVGSDGILVGPLARAAGQDNSVPCLRIFNPDGSEAEKSGNGLRIFSLYLAERGYVDPEAFFIRTKGGTVRAGVKSFDPPLIWVDMGEPSFSTKKEGLHTDKPEFVREKLSLQHVGEDSCPAALSVGHGPFDGQASTTVEASFVSMGNPHCVVFVDEPSERLARSLGPSIERNPLFPNRTNVQFAKVLDRKTLRIEIWERGAGYTLASGSSACAVAAVARKLGLIEPSDEVTVIMSGGSLTLDLSKPSITLMGPARNVFNGTFSASTKALLAKMRATEEI